MQMLKVRATVSCKATSSKTTKIIKSKSKMFHVLFLFDGFVFPEARDEELMTGVEHDEGVENEAKAVSLSLPPFPLLLLHYKAIQQIGRPSSATLEVAISYLQDVFEINPLLQTS